MESEVLFTKSAVIDLLSQIDELSDKSLQIDELPEGSISISIGDSTYVVDTTTVEDVEVDTEVVTEISDIDDTALTDLQDDGVIEEVEPIEGGLISEAIKTLAIGGLVRLTGKLMK